MSTSQTLAIVARETSAVAPGTCAACQRKGLPILPLRQAVLPVSATLEKHGTLSNPSTQIAARVLREGYVYVLLDQKIWQAYQVTPEGFLRQFNPYETPRVRPQPLAKDCIKGGHDLRASFLNIDAHQYKQAWIAFSQDPWPSVVLDAYKTGKLTRKDKSNKITTFALRSDWRQRFTVVDLAKLKADPSSGQALALEHAHPLTRHIAEYAGGVNDFGSVHGWHTRDSRTQALRDYLHILEKQYELPNGVAGIVLPDPAGVIHELNNLRLAERMQRQRWAEEPKNRYQYLTSQCLLGIKALEASRSFDEAASEAAANAAQAEAWNKNPYLAAKAGLPSVDVARQTGQLAQHKTASRHARLEQRYDEKARKAFQDGYDRAMTASQKRIDAYAKDWGEAVLKPDWLRIVELDYADTVPRSWAARLNMVSDCLLGGVSDAPPSPAKPGEKPTPEVPGPSGKAWQQLLSDPNSPAYTALQGQHTDMIAALTPLFAAGSMPNDAGKKYYDSLKGVAGGKELADLREHLTAGAADRLLAAMHDGANRLDRQLSDGARAALSGLHQGASWLYGGFQLTQVKIQLTVGECFDILSENLHGTVDSAAQGAGRRARAMVFAGLIAIPDPAVRRTVIEVTLWVQGNAEQVRQRLLSGGVGLKADANAALRGVTAGLKNLEPQVASALHDLRIGARAAREFASDSVRSLKSLSINGVDGGLSLISLYFLSDTLRSSLADLDAKLGARHPEAVAAFYGASVGMMGGGAEIAGQSLKIPGRAMQAFIARAGTEVTPTLSKVIGLGEGLVKAGGVIAAVGGIADGAGSFVAAARVARVGDMGAKWTYILAGGISLGGAFFGTTGALGAGTLMGPLGIGIALGLLAFAAVQLAKSLESDALELWARNSCFGSDPRHRRWGLTGRDAKPIEAMHIPNLMASAVAALNAAVIGMDVVLGFDSAKRPMDSAALAVADVEVLKSTGGIESGTALNYRVVLPGFDPTCSRYSFTLEVERFGVRKDGGRAPSTSKQTLASGQLNDSAAVAAPTTIARPDYTLEGESKPTAATPVLRGSYWLDAVNGMKSATFSVTYWPDRADQNGFAQITLTEQA
ncbi:T6SS effector BTH_I2691 family protein [Paraburkholderia tropica]|uniref:T6SS effector BTH_I2691 family protein n=1 Tax=Paraburkholderia tropica TaxID=92647 RepID=UPI002AB77E72|nr:T6SS effector BTH_I2691 family protein [Paraburkholderia tropica]